MDLVVYDDDEKRYVPWAVALVGVLLVALLTAGLTFLLTRQADAQKRFEAHQEQIKRMAAADAEAALPTSYTSGGGGEDDEQAPADGAAAAPRPAPAASGGTLASDEALQALREKLSGGGA